jgi:hypothetical protein
MYKMIRDIFFKLERILRMDSPDLGQYLSSTHKFQTDCLFIGNML